MSPLVVFELCRIFLFLWIYRCCLIFSLPSPSRIIYFFKYIYIYTCLYIYIYIYNMFFGLSSKNESKDVLTPAVRSPYNDSVSFIIKNNY